MTTHELAKELLALPDTTVIVRIPGELPVEIARVDQYGFSLGSIVELVLSNSSKASPNFGHSCPEKQKE